MQTPPAVRGHERQLRRRQAAAGGKCPACSPSNDVSIGTGLLHRAKSPDIFHSEDCPRRAHVESLRVCGCGLSHCIQGNKDSESELRLTFDKQTQRVRRDRPAKRAQLEFRKCASVKIGTGA
jgi:hypothetical protein